MTDNALDVLLCLETFLDATRRMNPKLHPSSEPAVIVRDCENVAKKARWERGI